MRDYPLLAISQIARVDDIGFYGTSRGGLSLDIRGTDFSATSVVLINGHRSPQFIVISDKRLLADLPRAVLGDTIKTLNVLKTTVTGVSEGSIISFEAIPISADVRSSTFLVQKVLKYLLTTKGSDIFAPNSGGNLQSLLGSVEQAGGSLSAYAQIYVQNALEDILRDQSGSTSPPEEKVQSINVISSSYSKVHTSLDIRMSITSMTGATVVAGLSI